jgi:FMNH2-dependent dimethyl sulfone monooxygenase
MHGHTVEEAAVKIADMKARRKKAGKEPLQSFGMAAYVICRDTEEEAQKELERITTIGDLSGYAGFKDFTTKSELEQKLQLQDYSVSNRGLRPNLIGTPEQIAKQILEFERVGVDLLLLQCSSQLEEMERFAKLVMPKVEELRSSYTNI